MALKVEIGTRIKTRRNELGLTQKQIQKATGISNGNLSGIESGKNFPSSTALIELSKILDCSIDWILTGQYPNLDISTLTLSDSETEIIELLRKLSPDSTKEVLNFIKFKIASEQMELSISMNGNPGTNNETHIA